MTIGINKGLKDTPQKDHRVMMEMSIQEAKAIKKLIRIGLVHKDGEFIGPDGVEAGREVIQSLDILNIF